MALALLRNAIEHNYCGPSCVGQRSFMGQCAWKRKSSAGSVPKPKSAKKGFKRFSSSTRRRLSRLQFPGPLESIPILREAKAEYAKLQ
jgi:hypothetical protein